MESYPLESLVQIKKKRFDEAVRLLEEKKELLAKAQKKLYDVTVARDQALEHKRGRLTQLRENLDLGVVGDKIEAMRSYLKMAEEQLQAKEEEVRKEEKAVKEAEKEVELATKELFQRKKDVEKMEMHRKEWDKEVHYERERQGGIEMDEQGSQQFETQRKMRKREQSS